MATSSNNVETNVFGALGAVLGYVGAEAAVPNIFERLLWPQRSYSNLQTTSLLRLALLGPMGGLLYKAAMQTLDTCFSNGLFKGKRRGDMLGTAFCHDLNVNATIHNPNSTDTTSAEAVRNCIWVRALSHLPALILDKNSARHNGISNKAEEGKAKQRTQRTEISVCHLTLTTATAKERNTKSIPYVMDAVDRCPLNVFIAITTAEASVLLTSVGVVAFLQSWWAIMWLVPLILRILSAVFALRREGLSEDSPTGSSSTPYDYEVHVPGSFILISGPPAVVLQFFRHYGHPIRDRTLETIQLLIVVLFGCVFPVELLCSMIWMPLPIQYVWLGYQTFAAIVMHASRYTDSAHWATVEEAIVKEVSAQVRKAGAGPQKQNEATILFGQSRKNSSTVKATFNVTYKSRTGEAVETVQSLLKRHPSQSSTPVLSVPGNVARA
jgi:hypothetical protein